LSNLDHDQSKSEDGDFKRASLQLDDRNADEAIEPAQSEEPTRSPL